MSRELMRTMGLRIWRIVIATPFLLIAAWCLKTMDLEKLATTAKPSADAKAIEWSGGKVDIVDFHGVALLDDLWRGGTATFSVSSFGYDSIASWQVFTFLVDLGPIFTIWILESTRSANAWSPAYLPTIFSFAAQLLGIGFTAPLFYFLCTAFGSSSAELAKSPPQRRTVWHGRNLLLIPLVIVLNTAEIFAMFLSQSYDDRHYWTWAWQLTPVWIGLGNMIGGRAIGRLRVATSPSKTIKPLLAVLGIISTGVWIYTISNSPHSLATLFVPELGPQDGLVLHSRKALQADELAAYSSSFLWLLYSFMDLYAAGMADRSLYIYSASAPVIMLAVGPGAAFLLGWYVRERALSAGKASQGSVLKNI